MSQVCQVRGDVLGAWVRDVSHTAEPGAGWMPTEGGLDARRHPGAWGRDVSHTARPGAGQMPAKGGPNAQGLDAPTWT